MVADRVGSNPTARIFFVASADAGASRLFYVCDLPPSADVGVVRPDMCWTCKVERQRQQNGSSSEHQEGGFPFTPWFIRHGAGVETGGPEVLGRGCEDGKANFAIADVTGSFLVLLATTASICACSDSKKM